MAENAAYATPRADLSVDAAPKDYPGLRRLPYFGWYLIVQVIYIAAVFAFPEPAALVAVVLFMLAASIYLLVQRLRNTGANGWWAAAMFVPLLNIYIGIKALAFPEGYDDHKQLDGPAKIIIGLVVGLMVLGIVAAVMVPALVS